MILTNNFKITNINNWFNERHVLCKFEQMLMNLNLLGEQVSSHVTNTGYVSGLSSCFAQQEKILLVMSYVLHLHCQTQPDTWDQGSISAV